jgi:hypothetical protein
MESKSKYMILVLLFLSLLSCRKDKVVQPIVEDPTKWELISGDYKVYDTLGEYLYQMEIKHKRFELHSGQIKDSLEFINFDDDFNFLSYQPQINDLIQVQIGSHDTLYAKDGTKWKLYSGNLGDFNIWSNDTIHLRFNRTNINYYLQDLVPYYECECKQIAVKQN